MTEFTIYIIIFLMGILLGGSVIFLLKRDSEEINIPPIQVVITKLKSGSFKWKLIRRDNSQKTLAFQPGSGFRRREDALSDAKSKFANLSDIEVMN